MEQNRELCNRILTALAPTNQPVNKPCCLIPPGKTAIHQELDDVNSRYDALRQGLGDSLEDLRIAERCEEEKALINNAEDWVQATQVKMEECKPQADEIDPLADELEVFMVRK